MTDGERRDCSFGFRVWGARGSLPRLAGDQAFHGGNTVCIEVLHPGDTRIILDAGTGIANLGDAILADSPDGGTIHLFFSHYHWDHIIGLPFFGPVYRRGFDIFLHGLRSAEGHLREMLEVVFSPHYSPIYSPDNLLGNLSVAESASPHRIDGLAIHTCELADIHPGGYMVTRVECGDRSFTYASDVELRDPGVVARFIQCCRGSDLLLCNGAFNEQRFAGSVGWGHSSIEASHEVASRAGVPHFMGIHFDPLRTDSELAEVLRKERGRFDDTHISLAYEGQEVWLG